MQIQSTRLYSKFKVIGGNRAIHETHLKTLMASISATNMLESNPIIVNKRMEVIDGQHRLEAAKRMHLEVYFVVAQTAEIREVQRLNTAVKRWGLDDFAISYAHKGNKEYKKVLEFRDRFGITMAEVVMMTQQGAKRWSHAIYEFKEGNHVCDNIENATRIAENAQQIARFVEPSMGRHLPEGFVRAIAFLDEKKPVSFTALIERLVENGQKIPRQSMTRDWLRAFEVAYNWKLTVNQVRFF